MRLGANINDLTLDEPKKLIVKLRRRIYRLEKEKSRLRRVINSCILVLRDYLDPSQVKKEPVLVLVTLLEHRLTAIWRQTDKRLKKGKEL